jgi:hypothetical protein
MIYLSGMASIIPLFLCLIWRGAAQPTRKPGPEALFDGKSLDAWRIFNRQSAEDVTRPARRAAGKSRTGCCERQPRQRHRRRSSSATDQLNGRSATRATAACYRGTDEFSQIYWSAPSISCWTT